MDGLCLDRFVVTEQQEFTRRGMNCCKTRLVAKLSTPKQSGCVGQNGEAERGSEITVKKRLRLELDFPRNALGLFHSESRFRPALPRDVEIPESFERRGRRRFTAIWNDRGFLEEFVDFEKGLAKKRRPCAPMAIANSDIGPLCRKKWVPGICGTMHFDFFAAATLWYSMLSARRSIERSS